MINSSRSTRHWNFYQVIYNLINKPAQKWISILRNNITNNKKKKTNLLLYISIYPPCLSLKLWKYNSKYNTKFIKNFLAPLHAYTSSLKKNKETKNPKLETIDYLWPLPNGLPVWTLVSRVRIFRAPRSSFIPPLDRPERTIVSSSDGPRGQSRRSRKVLSPVSFQNNGTLAVGHEREHRPSSLPKHYPHPTLRETDGEGGDVWPYSSLAKVTLYGRNFRVETKRLFCLVDGYETSFGGSKRVVCEWYFRYD